MAVEYMSFQEVLEELQIDDQQIAAILAAMREARGEA